MPKSYKRGLVFTLLFRIFSIVSDPAIRIEEVKKLKNILARNAYPYHLLDNWIKRFLDKTNRTTPANNSNEETNIKTVKIILPYLGPITSNLQKELKELFKRSLPNHKIRLINKMSYRIGNLFRYKDLCPESIMSDLVYFYKCSCCNAAYVGKTYRHKKVRICEHRGVSARTGKVVIGTSTTAIRDHMLECDTIVCNDDFNVLSKGGDRVELEIKESIMIKKLRPSLNKDIQSTPLYLFT